MGPTSSLRRITHPKGITKFLIHFVHNEFGAHTPTLIGSLRLVSTAFLTTLI